MSVLPLPSAPAVIPIEPAPHSLPTVPLEAVSTEPALLSALETLPASSPLRRVVRLLMRQDYAQAIELLQPMPKNEVTRNTLAVCHLRAGAVEPALAILRAMSLMPGTTVVRLDARPEVVRNLATALLLHGTPSGALDALIATGDLESPRSRQIRQAIDRWARSLSLFRRLDWKLNRVEPAGAKVAIDFPAGEFFFKAIDTPTRRS